MKKKLLLMLVCSFVFGLALLPSAIATRTEAETTFGGCACCCESATISACSENWLCLKVYGSCWGQSTGVRLCYSGTACGDFVCGGTRTDWSCSHTQLCEEI